MVCGFTILHCIMHRVVDVKCRTPCSYRSFESLNMENDFILSVHFYVTDSTLSTAMIGDNTNSSFDEIHHVFIMKYVY